MSEDGVNFRTVKVIPNARPLTKQSKTNDIQNFSSGRVMQKARYVKIIGHNMKTPPLWHHGTGLGAWIFADEIVITP